MDDFDIIALGATGAALYILVAAYVGRRCFDATDGSDDKLINGAGGAVLWPVVVVVWILWVIGRCGWRLAAPHPAIPKAQARENRRG